MARVCTGVFPVLLAFCLCGAQVCADWPMLRGAPGHSGFVEGNLPENMRLLWAREFKEERLSTALEPILAQGRLFVGTHQGRLYALDAPSGRGLWCFEAAGPFLHAPASADGLVVAGSVDGRLYGLRAADGKLAWSVDSTTGGFSAAPTISGGTVFIGTRAGDFLAVSIGDGQVRWHQTIGVPIRQTAAVAAGRVFVMGEDLRVRCFSAADGTLHWCSDSLAGQTGRDYYPVVVTRNGRTYVVVRTNPLLNMGQRIGQDRTLLCRNAGVDDSSWTRLDAWLKSDAAHGNPSLWAKEQQAVAQFLADSPQSRTFFSFDADSGEQTGPAPVLWIAGCQGVGVQPAATQDGRLLVFYRSAYGNWSLGVAPLVALGLLDLADNRISPLFHAQGRQPPWNCFWGTADEAQNFLVVGNSVLIVHQGTLSRLDLGTAASKAASGPAMEGGGLVGIDVKLAPVSGERDTFGGFHNPAWARNEWHGPARSGVALDGNRIYWQTGSRILCLGPGAAPEAPVQPMPVEARLPATKAPPVKLPGAAAIRDRLAAAVDEVLSRPWAPLFTDPGLSGRVFSFDESGALFEALAWAYPHLDPDLQRRLKNRLAQEWERHRPFRAEGSYSLHDGTRREYFHVPPELCARLGKDPRPHPFGGVHVAWLFARRCGEERLLLESWPEITAAFESFRSTGWRLDPTRGDLFANRYVASLFAVAQIAAKAGDGNLSSTARADAERAADSLVAWWKRAAQTAPLGSFDSSADLDRFINEGNALWFCVAPHRHELALFRDLSPEVAGWVRSRAGNAVDHVWTEFVRVCPTWMLAGEERQVHFGENFVDPPQFALGAFEALAWLKAGTRDDLARAVDLPFCHADLDYVTKLALALEGSEAPR